MRHAIRKDLEDLLTYNWSDEVHDFQVQIDDGEPTGQHIFRVMVRLSNELHGTKDTPESYLRK